MADLSDLATIGTVYKTTYDAWLVEFSALWIEQGEDTQHDAASSLAKAKQCLRRFATDNDYTGPFRWEHVSRDMYRLYAKAPPEDDGT